MTSIEFGNLVKEKRKEAGLSQNALGMFIWPNRTPAVAQKRVSHIEGGIEILDPKSLAAICRKLNIKPVPSVETLGPKELEFHRKKNVGSLYLLNPEISPDDFRLISENTALTNTIEAALAVLIREKCSKLREALGIPEPE